MDDGEMVKDRRSGERRFVKCRVSDEREVLRLVMCKHFLGLDGLGRLGHLWGYNSRVGDRRLIEESGTDQRFGWNDLHPLGNLGKRGDARGSDDLIFGDESSINPRWKTVELLDGRGVRDWGELDR